MSPLDVSAAHAIMSSKSIDNLGKGGRDLQVSAAVAGRCPVIAIIGGGFCGTLTAVQLLRRAGPGTRILLIERSGDFGPGVAYSTRDDRHVLNVPAARMSAFTAAPGDLVEWAGVERDAYVPRRVYGEYLRARLAGAAARSAARLERVTGEVVRARPARGAIELVLADGGRVACDRAVLAVGSLPPAPVCELPDDERVIHDPWRELVGEEGEAACDGLGGFAPLGGLAAARRDGLVAARPARRFGRASSGDGMTTLVIGSGPTAVDVALTLCGSSPRARVIAVSRHGRLPFAHLGGLRRPVPAPALPTGPLRLSELEYRIRTHVARVDAGGGDWRDAIDGLRPLLPDLWRRLPLSDRRRFLRERLRTWEVRRHRLAPAAAASVRGLRVQGRLTVLAGGVERIRSRRGGIEVRLHDGRSLAAARVVTCTGAGLAVAATPDPLVRGLLADGHADADPLGLGLRATPAGALLDAVGHADERLWVLGPLRRGELWESTAVQELRDQAVTVADGVCASLAVASPEPLSVPA